MWDLELERCRRKEYLFFFCTAYVDRTADPPLPDAVREFLTQLEPLPPRGQWTALIDANVNTRFLLEQFRPRFASATISGDVYPPSCDADHLVVELDQRCFDEYDDDGEPNGLRYLENGYRSEDDEDQMVESFVLAHDSSCRSPNIFITSAAADDHYEFCEPPRLSLRPFFRRGGGALTRAGDAPNALTVDDTVECVLPGNAGVYLKYLLHMSTRSENSFAATFHDASRVIRKIFGGPALNLARALADSSRGQLTLLHRRTPNGHELEANFTARDGTKTGALWLTSEGARLHVAYRYNAATTLAQRAFNMVNYQGIDTSAFTLPLY